MISHLLKLVWNRKRANFLIILEICFSFMVLFAIITFASYYIDNYSLPLGYSYEDVWRLQIQVDRGGDLPRSENEAEMIRQIMLAIRDFDEVESLAASYNSPYDFNTSATGINSNGKYIRFEVDRATDTYADVMQLNVVEGRWFNQEDDADNIQPAVINFNLREQFFGDGPAIGQKLSYKEWQRRIVGVVDYYRKDGEFSSDESFLFDRMKIEQPAQFLPQGVMIKMKPGVTRAFEEELIRRVQGVAKQWSFTLKPLSEMRSAFHKFQLSPLIAASVISVFLLLMVALGLVGVLWQNVTQRTREIGLRRAKGATRPNIHSQILGELLTIATFGITIGVVIVMQFPILDLISFLSLKIYVISLLVSGALIYFLTTVCGLYPSYLATRIHPAAALHYE